MDKFNLNNADMTAINDGAEAYINNKGVKFYNDGSYHKAVEYYRLGATMGCVNSISNLGYCYLYGRDIEKNTSLAIAYFTLASKKGDIDAAYKLGDIYSSDKYGLKDTELSIYYYTLATERILGCGISECQLEDEEGLDEYPSLCFAIARETLPGGSMNTNIKISYHMLKHAEIGYKMAIDNGNVFYSDCYNRVKDMLKDNSYDDYRDEIDKLY